ncbi:hypothetical protein DFA_08968 [Cavenderia fasciculata]|uniref:Uncharacterized protein n=1 Tax=Cavenderia fasciculata TaxID=261658 RepID=F4Q6C0_CACFS|nr:uncharacterized protein DFA_08968 [Cavenderia fasciculata]EGG16430.1 hypothetical protein DFA_08968 [Cavenderia fasciculata]|eukprot:XP_004354830.1 hypothetical protein DFA_08968 [Cavenderia fasciculata]
MDIQKIIQERDTAVEYLLQLETRAKVFENAFKTYQNEHFIEKIE